MTLKNDNFWVKKPPPGLLQENDTCIAKATSTLLLQVAELPQDSGETSFLSSGAQEDDHTIRFSLRQDRPNRKSTLIKSPNLAGKAHSLVWICCRLRPALFNDLFWKECLAHWACSQVVCVWRIGPFTGIQLIRTSAFLHGKSPKTSPVPFLHFPQPSSQSPPSIERHPVDDFFGVPLI